MSVLCSKGTLCARISGCKALNRAWASVRRGSSADSCGPDGITREQFERNWAEHRRVLRDQIRTGTYRMGPYRGVAIRKRGDRPPVDPKSWRPISIANIRDRVVQRAVLDAIWTSIRKYVYTDSSFGGLRKYHVGLGLDEDARPCVKSAARRIVELRQQGYTWILETDIENFFPSIRKEDLLAKLLPLLKDASLDEIISSSISTTIDNHKNFQNDFASREKLWDPIRGVPQGGVLSPVLANFYLFEFDRAICAAGFKLVRYVDDLIILATSEESARAAYTLCRGRLAELGLFMHPLEPGSKTCIKGPGQSFTFLGLEFNSRTIMPAPRKIVELLDKIGDLAHPRGDSCDLVQLVGRINWCLTGWIEAFKFCNLPDAELRRIDYEVSQRIRRWLAHHRIIRRESALPNEAYKWLGVIPLSKVRIQPILQSMKSRIAAAQPELAPV